VFLFQTLRFFVAVSPVPCDMRLSAFGGSQADRWDRRSPLSSVTHLRFRGARQTTEGDGLSHWVFSQQMYKTRAARRLSACTTIFALASCGRQATASPTMTPAEFAAAAGRWACQSPQEASAKIVVQADSLRAASSLYICWRKPSGTDHRLLWSVVPRESADE